MRPSIASGGVDSVTSNATAHWCSIALAENGRSNHAWSSDSTRRCLKPTNTTGFFSRSCSSRRTRASSFARAETSNNNRSEVGVPTLVIAKRVDAPTSSSTSTMSRDTVPFG